MGKPASTFVYFLTLGIVSFLILRSEITLTTIMQILAILSLLSIISARFILSKLQRPVSISVFLLGILPVILFVDLLVFSTGGLSSPFLILTHFLPIGLAFLISPQIAVSFIGATILLALSNLTIDPSAQALLFQTPLAVFLYFVAYLALIPFSYILAREYRIKEEWAFILEKQIATSKTQEEELLKNITSAVFILNPELQLISLNQAAMTLSGYGKEILGKDFFKFFSFKDKEGRTLQAYSLPFAQTLSSKIQSFLENIHMQAKEKDYFRIDLKILPAISPKGPLGLILIAEDRAKKEKTDASGKTTAPLALVRFLISLRSQKRTLQNLGKNTQLKEQSENLIKQNQLLENLASDFVYSLSLESGEVGALSSLVDLSELVEKSILETKPQALELGITLVAKRPKENIPLVQPKEGLRIPVAKGVFPQVYVIGNTAWLADSFKRIIGLILILAKKGQKIEIEVASFQGLAQVRITTPDLDIAKEQILDLFEKFHGRLKDDPRLFETSGLEGYIAKNLIERMAGNISVEEQKESPQITICISFGEHQTESNITLT